MYARRDVMPDEIKKIAEAVGRKQRKRSSPPMYTLKGRPPLPIHIHPFALKKRVKEKSLEMLEGDLDMWELMLEAER